MKLFESREKICNELDCLCEKINKSSDELKREVSKLNLTVKDLQRKKQRYASTYLNLIDELNN